MRACFYALLCVGTCSVTYEVAWTGEPPSGNLAIGKPYTFSVWPRPPRGQPAPNFQQWLTDGKYGKLPSWRGGSGWISFFKAADVEVVVDLGAVYPIGEIQVRHDSDLYHRFQPRKELYYVSEDGRTSYQIGECRNTWDPGPPIDESLREKFFKGVKTFTSGPVRTSGRYVMVRTFPALVAGKRILRESMAGTYVGYDEIVVRRGEFDVGAISVDRTRAYVCEPAELPPEVLGYRCSTIPWEDLFRDGPLFVGATPYAYLREDEFHLSVGGTYVLAFEPRSNTKEPVSDVEFEWCLPNTVAIVSMADSMTLKEKEQITRDGKPCTIYTAEVEAGPMQPKTYRDRYGLPALVLAADTNRVGALGRLDYRCRYTCGGRRFDPAPKSLALILDEAIQAEPPKEFVQGIWIMRISSRFRDYDKTMRRLLAFYNSIGFNSAFGSGSPEIYPMLKELGMVRYLNTGGKFCPNGYQFNSKDGAFWNGLPETDHFRFHPRFERHRRRAVCPATLASEELFSKVKAKAKELLAASDHLYANWEPYMFQKRGCVCDRCRSAFQESASLSAEDVTKVWPACVVDLGSDAHNRFTSHQIARVHAQLQRAVRDASKELGRVTRAEFVPSVSDKEFNPEDARYRTNGSREYAQSLDGVSIWGMPFDTSIGIVNLPRGIGNNLAMAHDITNTLKVVDEYGRKEDGRRRPRAYNVSGLHFVGESRFAMPRDHYFTAMLNFLSGMDGHGSYREFGVDARFLRLRAKAARSMAMYEKWTLHGEARANYSITPASALPAIPNRTILFARFYEHAGQQIIAVGNDYYYPMYVTAQVAGLPPAENYNFIDRINRRAFGGRSGFSAADLARGVLIDVPGKEFRILEVRRGLRAHELNGFALAAPAEVQAAFALDRQRLVDQARFIVSFCN